MMNELRSLAITADSLSFSNISEIQALLSRKNCSHVSFFLAMSENTLQDLKRNIDNSNVKVEFFIANYARERSLEKLSKAIQHKRAEKLRLGTSGACCDEFSEEEILRIFSSSSELLHYDLIILADSSRDSLGNNFITDASYAEIYMAQSTFTGGNFDLRELEAAIEFYEGIQRNFGS